MVYHKYNKCQLPSRVYYFLVSIYFLKIDFYIFREALFEWYADIQGTLKARLR